jgi:hypothetical protein
MLKSQQASYGLFVFLLVLKIKLSSFFHAFLLKKFFIENNNCNHLSIECHSVSDSLLDIAF